MCVLSCAMIRTMLMLLLLLFVEYEEEAHLLHKL